MSKINISPRLAIIAGCLLIAPMNMTQEIANLAIIYDENEGIVDSLNIAMSMSVRDVFKSQITPILVPGNLALRVAMLLQPPPAAPINAEKQSEYDAFFRRVEADLKAIEQTEAAQHGAIDIIKRNALQDEVGKKSSAIFIHCFYNSYPFKQKDPKITVNQATTYKNIATQLNELRNRINRESHGKDRFKKHQEEFLPGVNLSEWQIFLVTHNGNATPQHLVLFIPTQYARSHAAYNEATHAVDLAKLGFNVSNLKLIKPKDLAAQATGYDFPEEKIASSIKQIFNLQKAPNPVHWNIYITGHGRSPEEGISAPTVRLVSHQIAKAKATPTAAAGAVGAAGTKESGEQFEYAERPAHIAGMPGHEFLKLMDLWSTLATNIVVFETCFGGGLNMQAIQDTFLLQVNLASKALKAQALPVVVSLAPSEQSTRAHDADFTKFFDELQNIFSPPTKSTAETKKLLEKACKNVSDDYPVAIFPPKPETGTSAGTKMFERSQQLLQAAVTQKFSQQQYDKIRKKLETSMHENATTLEQWAHSIAKKRAKKGATPEEINRTATQVIKERIQEEAARELSTQKIDKPLAKETASVVIDSPKQKKFEFIREQGLILEPDEHGGLKIYGTQADAAHISSTPHEIVFKSENPHITLLTNSIPKKLVFAATKGVPNFDPQLADINQIQFKEIEANVELGDFLAQAFKEHGRNLRVDIQTFTGQNKTPSVAQLPTAEKVTIKNVEFAVCPYYTKPARGGGFFEYDNHWYLYVLTEEESGITKTIRMKILETITTPPEAKKGEIRNNIIKQIQANCELRYFFKFDKKDEIDSWLTKSLYYPTLAQEVLLEVLREQVKKSSLEAVEKIWRPRLIKTMSAEDVETLCNRLSISEDFWKRAFSAAQTEQQALINRLNQKQAGIILSETYPYTTYDLKPEVKQEISILTQKIIDKHKPDLINVARNIRIESSGNQWFFEKIISAMAPDKQIKFLNGLPATIKDTNKLGQYLLAAIPAIKIDDHTLNTTLNAIVQQNEKTRGYDYYDKSWFKLLHWLIDNKLDVFVCSGADERGFVSTILASTYDDQQKAMIGQKLSQTPAFINELAAAIDGKSSKPCFNNIVLNNDIVKPVADRLIQINPALKSALQDLTKPVPQRIRSFIAQQPPNIRAQLLNAVRQLPADAYLSDIINAMIAHHFSPQQVQQLIEHSLKGMQQLDINNAIIAVIQLGLPNKLIEDLLDLPQTRDVWPLTLKLIAQAIQPLKSPKFNEKLKLIMQNIIDARVEKFDGNDLANLITAASDIGFNHETIEKLRNLLQKLIKQKIDQQPAAKPFDAYDLGNLIRNAIETNLSEEYFDKLLAQPAIANVLSDYSVRNKLKQFVNDPAHTQYIVRIVNKMLTLDPAAFASDQDFLKSVVHAVNNLKLPQKNIEAILKVLSVPQEPIIPKPVTPSVPTTPTPQVPTAPGAPAPTPESGIIPEPQAPPTHEPIVPSKPTIPDTAPIIPEPTIPSVPTITQLQRQISDFDKQLKQPLETAKKITQQLSETQKQIKKITQEEQSLKKAQKELKNKKLLRKQKQELTKKVKGASKKLKELALMKKRTQLTVTTLLKQQTQIQKTIAAIGNQKNRLQNKLGGKIGGT